MPCEDRDKFPPMFQDDWNTPEANAYMTLTQMYSHRGDGIPTCFLHSDEIREAARVLMNYFLWKRHDERVVNEFNRSLVATLTQDARPLRWPKRHSLLDEALRRKWWQIWRL